MSQLQMTILLLAVVISVLAATRPTPPRRRRGRSPRSRDNQSGPKRRHPAPLLARRPPLHSNSDPINRNRWDRADIATGVGRDHAEPDLTLTLWPEPR
jgi:hypothetical protein